MACGARKLEILVVDTNVWFKSHNENFVIFCFVVVVVTTMW